VPYSLSEMRQKKIYVSQSLLRVSQGRLERIEQSTMAEPVGKRPGERVPSCPSLAVALSSGVVPLRYCFILVYPDPILFILALFEHFQDLTEFIFTQ